MSFAAIVSIGAISVSLNAWWTEDELDYALEDCGATVLIADRERVERSRAACARLGIRTIGVRGATGDGVDPWAPPLGRPMPDVDVDARRRRDDPLHERHDRSSRRVPSSTHRAVVQSLMAFALPRARSRRCATQRRPPTLGGAMPRPPANPPSFILIVPLFHVTGMRAR